MIYQLVSEPRTGSSVLSSYLRYYYKLKKIPAITELFLNRYTIKNNSLLDNKELWDELIIDESYDIIKSKIDFLEFNAQKNIHYHFKFFPSAIIYEDLRKRMCDFLNQYDIITIDRNPYEIFLSTAYQDNISWKHTHRNKNEIINVKPFNIEKNFIISWVNNHEINTDFISNLNVVKTFKYEELNKKNITDFLNYQPPSIWPKEPMNIDYEKYIINLNEVKSIYNYLME